MRRRTFEEMIMYFNQTVSEMDIDRKYKMTLLGIVTALLQKHDEDVAPIVRCKDCKHRPMATRAKEGIFYGFSVAFPDDTCPCQCDDGYYSWYPKDNFYCGYAERRTDELGDS